MKKILFIGLNNSISKVFQKETFYGEKSVFYTQSKDENQVTNNTLYLNFLSERFDDQLKLLHQIFAESEAVVFISSYYGSKSETLNLIEYNEVQLFIRNSYILIESFIEHKKQNCRIIFIGSIADNLYNLGAYPMYKIFKNELKNLSALINTYNNKKGVSSTYLNLGSFRDEVSETSFEQINTKEVIKTLEFLFTLPPNVKVEHIDLKPILE